MRSGGYYMFDETESEIVDLNEKPRQSLIPDPEGDEMRKIAKVHGFTAVSILLFHTIYSMNI